MRLRSHAERQGARRGVLLLVIIALTASVCPPALAVERIGGRDIASAQLLALGSPELSAPAGILTTRDGRVLWERDAHQARPMASTTKIMTALVVLERADLDAVATVSEAATAVEGSTAGLVAGQRVPVRTLLAALLVRSANDAAIVLAEHVAGSVEAFVRLMNAKARELGLEDTHFTNPHGLDEEGHESSAADLATLARVAMAHPTFAEIVGRPDVVVPRAKGGARRYETTNRLVTDYPGATGVKTGWTDGAGYCVVASAERDGVGLVAVVLGARSAGARFADTRALLDWGFEHYRKMPLARPDEALAFLPVEGRLGRLVPVVAAEQASAVVFEFDGQVVRHLDLRPSVVAPVARGEDVGVLTVVQNGRVLAQVPLVAGTDVPAPRLAEALRAWIMTVWRSALGTQAGAL